ncbi:MAG: hypothetical protein II859_13515 [Bacteroidales bacterium]|nr:hypothetical protein [Bacteroidales bacterium]
MPKTRNLNNPTQAERSGAQCGVATAVRELRARGTLLPYKVKKTSIALGEPLIRLAE